LPFGGGAAGAGGAGATGGTVGAVAEVMVAVSEVAFMVPSLKSEWNLR
jgi:hypothetical protein